MAQQELLARLSMHSGLWRCCWYFDRLMKFDCGADWQFARRLSTGAVAG
jgi:hypothetical protein